MKQKIPVIVFLLIFLLPVSLFAQGDYSLGLMGEYNNFSMMVGEKQDIAIFQNDGVERREANLLDGGLVVTINGHAINEQNPEDGDLMVSMLGKLSYKAPNHIPSANPVAIGVSFISPADHKTKIILLANITIVAGYKLSLNMDVKLKDLSLSCEATAYLKLQQQADKSYFLLPFHGENVLPIRITNYSIPNAQYLSPLQYNTPVFITVSNDKNDPQCIINFHAINNIEQTIAAEGHTSTRTFEEPFLTYVNNIFLSGKASMNERYSDNMAVMNQQLEWGQRMKAHANDPAYMNSAQGKADLAEMKKISSEVKEANGQGQQKLIQSLVHFKNSFHFKSDIAFSLEQQAAQEVQSAASGDLKIKIEYLH